MNRIILALTVVGALLICHTSSALDNDAPLQKADHLAGAPIPSGPGIHLVNEAEELSKAWCKRVMLDAYNKTPNPNSRVAEFIRQGIEVMHSMEPSSKSQQAEANALIDAGVDDPVFDYLADIVLNDKRGDLLTRAMAGMDKSPYNKIIFYMISVDINQDMHARKTPKETKDTQFKTTLDLLRDALDADAFKPNETMALLYRLDSDAGEYLFAGHATQVCDILKASKKVPQWVAEYYDGKRYIQDAWKARGGDWASTVTPEGWKGFADNLAQARIHLVKSWELNHACPRAAARMIEVAMCESEHNDTMRKWFDRSVAAQMDYMPAYAQLRWGLRPRWLGSAQELLRFGTECMRTGRYDTGVPYEYVLAVKDISSDSDDKGAIFSDPKINKNVTDVINAYLDNKQNSLDHKYLHAMAAVVAYKVGKLDVAKQHMEAINYNVKGWSRDLGAFVNFPAMLAEIRDYKPQ